MENDPATKPPWFRRLNISGGSGRSEGGLLGGKEDWQACNNNRNCLVIGPFIFSSLQRSFPSTFHHPIVFKQRSHYGSAIGGSIFSVEQLIRFQPGCNHCLWTQHQTSHTMSQPSIRDLPSISLAWQLEQRGVPSSWISSVPTPKVLSDACICLLNTNTDCFTLLLGDGRHKNAGEVTISHTAPLRAWYLQIRP